MRGFQFASVKQEVEFPLLAHRAAAVNMAATDIQEFLEQNRSVADRVENHRGVSETNKQWDARREFILRNINEFEEEHVDQLLALSMVWANNVFMGCRCVNNVNKHVVNSPVRCVKNVNKHVLLARLFGV